MTTQQKFWNDIGPTPDAGETLGISLPTPQARDHCNGSISSVADSPANLFQWLEPDAGRVMSVGCGTSFAKLSASSGPDTCWLKTSQDCSVQRMLLDDEGDCLEEWSETWPHWGTMLNGVCYRQRPLVRRISAREYSLLPTPSSNPPQMDGARLVDKDGNPPTHFNQRLYDKETGRLCQKGIQQMAQTGLLPTPQHHDSRSQGMQREVKDGRIQAANGGESQSINLGTMGMMGLLPPPTRRDYKSGKGKTQEERGRTAGPSLSETSGGLLSPRFVEAIMGFPIGWTDLDA